MGVHFDTSEVNRLAVDLSEAPLRMQRRALKEMKTAAGHVEDIMRADATGHRHLAELQNYVDKSRLDSLGLSWEIGFNKGGQGSLANIAAFGTSNNAPVMDIGHGLRVEAPALANRLGAAAEDSVLGGAE